MGLSWLALEPVKPEGFGGGGGADGGGAFPATDETAISQATFPLKCTNNFDCLQVSSGSLPAGFGGGKGAAGGGAFPATDEISPISRARCYFHDRPSISKKESFRSACLQVLAGEEGLLAVAPFLHR